MMSKKIASNIIITSFVVIICFSWPLAFLLSNFLDLTNHENRTLAAKPEFSLENYLAYTGDYEAYINDNIPFREYLLLFYSGMDYVLFSRSQNNRVIIGLDDWLFYGDKHDGNSIGDYEGTNLLGDEHLLTISQKCMEINDFLKSQGKEFVLFIAPNKERIYYERMPRQYGMPAEVYRTMQVVQYLRDNTDIRVVYPYEELMNAKNDLQQNIYYKTDTHWNDIGGYIGACALLKELDIDMPDIFSEKIEISETGSKQGDLATILNIGPLYMYNDSIYKVSGYETHNMSIKEWDFSNALIYHAENADPRKLYVYRDSFASSMADCIGAQFNDSYFRHQNTYSYDDFLEQNPDIFVYETVERNVWWGLTNFTIW